ncbi:MAG: type VI secretion protein IcmF/TssM N-terminal domain-containing protein [Desulfobacterales bacterium]|jgi:type VI secretion system protein ImpL|nr:type VI secretion protein IcmF/TssM N-terminal domain-containing protein [Desulfobacterales bacterium]
MKALLIKILKVCLIISVAMLGLALVFGGVLVLGWPWWVGFFVLIGLAGLAAGILFIKKLFQRKREQHFVQQVIHQEAAYVATLGDKDKERSRELQDRWKEAMDALRNSHLKKMGNPLYVLPWYMIIGESGSGKTTSIKSARLSSPFAEVRKTSGISGTRNCDWWFFEQAIIIDTAGRYAIPVDEGRDKDEWQRFLSQLVKFRKREPLNGLIITVAADKLLSADSEALLADGRSLRQRMDELMRVLGAKFPVYVLITKCDLIQGMTQYCDRLPEKALDRAMGFLNHDLTSDITTFNERAMHTIVERLKDIRLQLLHQPAAGKADPALLLFPEEFERLKSSLFAFTHGAFQENPYQETPILRGIFFSSGRQEGSPYSHFLKALGLIEDRDVLPGTSKGMFLFDFFSRILPSDRRIFAPTLHAIQWNRLTRNLGLTAWVAIVIALCGLLSFSFVKNMRILKEFSYEFAEPPVLRGELVSDVILMDRFRETLLKMEERNRDWWLPRFYLNESQEVETRIKTAYCKQFEEGLIGAYDKRMAERIAGFSVTTPCRTLGQHLAHMIRRINLLQARLAGADLAALQERPQPGFETFAAEENLPLMPELQDRLAHLYQYDLIWQPDRNRINQESITLQAWMKQILSTRQNDLSCLVDMVNADPSLKGLTLADFWGGDPDPADSIAIAPAYTLKGKEAIDIFLQEIEAASPDPLVIAGAKQAFQRDYKKAYLDAWEAFGTQLPEGVNRLSGIPDWHQIIDRIGTGQGPFFSFLARMKDEIAPFSQDTDRAWVGLVNDFDRAKQTAAGQDMLPKTGLLSKAAEKGKSLLSKVEKAADDTQASALIESRLTAASALRDYQKALVEIVKAIATRKGAYEIAAKTFDEEAASPPSPFILTQTSIRTMEATLQNSAGQSAMFWALVSGPHRFLWDFVLRETACYIDKLWEEKVLVEVQGISDSERITAVALGEKGPAMDFVKGPIAPFIDRSLNKGFYAKNVLGREIQFKTDFLRYLTQGTRKVRAAQARAARSGADEDVVATPLVFNGGVTIKALPTDVNPDAHTRPQATTLTVRCGNETAQLINLNYPVRKVFDWSSETCDEVVFTVEIGSIVLTKRYKGNMGFPLFLKDFGNGTRRLYPGDFPQNKSALQQANIKYIQVNYQFERHSRVLSFYQKYLAAKSSVKKVSREPSTPKVPRNAAICWDY